MSKLVQEDINAGIWLCAALLAFNGGFNVVGCLLALKAAGNFIYSNIEAFQKRAENGKRTHRNLRQPLRTKTIHYIIEKEL